MPLEPAVKRAVAFVDGQNLFHAAREAYGYAYPNFDVLNLARVVCAAKGWSLSGVRFYTGVPDARDNAFWNHFWTAKLAQMGREGVATFSRPLRYRNQTIELPNGSKHAMLVGQEKGIDVRLALDVVRSAHNRAIDVALIFSQDQDLSEVADELKTIVGEQRRWIRMASAFPTSPTSRNTRGINGTEWVPLERATYDLALDRRDYRPKAR